MAAAADAILSMKTEYHPVMAYKYQRECCTNGTCAVATFKPECCIRDAKPKCHHLCAKNNSACHDTLCCECHQTTIYHSTAPDEMRKPAFVCGGCGYRVCHKCLPTIIFKFDAKTSEKFCPRCDFYW